MLIIQMIISSVVNHAVRIVVPMRILRIMEAVAIQFGIERNLLFAHRLVRKRGRAALRIVTEFAAFIRAERIARFELYGRRAPVRENKAFDPVRIKGNHRLIRLLRKHDLNGNG